MRRRTVILLVTVTALVGCTGRTETDGDITRVDQTTSTQVTVTDGVTLNVQPGDFTTDATITVSRSTTDPVDVPWFTPAGPPVDIDISTTPAAPLELNFDAEPPSPDAIAVVWRHDPDEGWYPIATADGPGQPVTTSRDLFSPHLFGWFRPVVDWVADGVRHLLGDRSDPLACSGPPQWAELTPPSQDLVHTCATTGTDDQGNEVVEVQLRNNRGIYLEVVVPPGARYAWVEHQPDPVRAAVRSLTGRDSILLAPGQRMTVGIPRPELGQVIQVDVDMSSVGIVATLITEHIGQEASTVYAALVALRDCTGVSSVTAASGPEALVAAAQNLLACAEDVLTAQGSATIAAEWVAAENGVSTTSAIADRALAVKVDKLAGTLAHLGTALTALTLGSNVIDIVADTIISAEVGGVDSLSPTLALTGSQVPLAEVPFGPDGYGPFILGTTWDQAATALPFHDFTSDAGEFGCATFSSAQVGVTVFAYTGAPIFAIQALDSAPRTPEGIGIGSTLADVRAAYPGAGPVDTWGGDASEVGNLIVDIPGPGTYEFTMGGLLPGTEDGWVTMMSLVADNVAGSPEWCG